MITTLFSKKQNKEQLFTLDEELKTTENKKEIGR